MKNILYIVGGLAALVSASVAYAQTTDSVRPGPPGNVQAQAVTSNRIEVTWDAATDNVGVVGYGVRRNNIHIATTTTTSFQDGGVSPGTSYTYNIRSVDAAGNISFPSSSSTATTLGTNTGGTGGTGGGTGGPGGTGGTPTGGTGGVPTGGTGGTPTGGTPTGGGTTNGTTPTTPGNTSDQYQYQRQGVFGCNLNGAYAMSVGALSARGGVYVPVNDAAVTLNTGYLVYKECVLDGVTKREAESASSALANQTIRGCLTGRDGKPCFSVDFRAEATQRVDQVVVDALKEENIAPMCEAFRGQVRTAVVRDYLASRQPNNQLKCTLDCSAADMQALLKGDVTKCGGISGLFKLVTNPVNSPAGGYYVLENKIRNEALTEVGIMRDQLLYSNGVYPNEHVDTSGPYTVRRTQTPGYIVAQTLGTAIGSGYNQLQNATEIDQMVGSLYAGMSTHVVTDSGGLSGVLQSAGTQIPYLDQVARESAAGLRNSVVNAGLVTLNAARSVETQYLTIVNAIGTALTNAINQLRTTEQNCWNLVIPKAQEYARNNGGFPLRIATTTEAFAQKVISAEIGPYAQTAVDNIRAAERAVSLINQLIQGITNTNSLDAQRIALQQLDNLVATRQIHTQNDLATVEQQREAVVSSTNSIVQTTISTWGGDSTDPSVAWCNINNAEVAKYWAEKWRQ